MIVDDDRWLWKMISYDGDNDDYDSEEDVGDKDDYDDDDDDVGRDDHEENVNHD